MNLINWFLLHIYTCFKISRCHIYFKHRKEVWATFPKLDQAIRFVDNHPDVHVFSYQDHLTEQRRFLVSNYNEFWRRLSSNSFLLSLLIKAAYVFYTKLAKWKSLCMLCLTFVVVGISTWSPSFAITMKSFRR